MHWLGELCQKEIESTDTVLDLMCGKCDPVLDLDCKSYLGVDAFPSWIEEVKDRLSVVKFDVLNLSDLCLDKSFDVVLCLDGLEHLLEEEMKDLLASMIKIARKRVVVFTPMHFSKQDELGNPYNQHHCLVTIPLLQQYGFQATQVPPTYNVFGVWRVEDQEE
ncbi:MAG: class I SAM-dependent methyltransferase [Promethearchaeota archaeon]|jgi:ubiquinone/menaquinone biosynthesis C-methylase UbiE